MIHAAELLVPRLVVLLVPRTNHRADCAVGYIAALKIWQWLWLRAVDLFVPRIVVLLVLLLLSFS